MNKKYLQFFYLYFVKNKKSDLLNHSGLANRFFFVVVNAYSFTNLRA
jgi:hypothetical protein